MTSPKPTISSLAEGQVFWDALPYGQDEFLLRFQSGLEINVAWASSGPEVKNYWYRALTILATERALHPQFQYVSGKTVLQVLTDGCQLIISFTDGHELRSDFRRCPEPVAVDAKIILKPLGDPGLFGVQGKAL